MEESHRFVKTNGIRMHVAERGRGRLVVLCHGFPEGWYSWRHQLSALASAGYQAVHGATRGYRSLHPLPSRRRSAWFVSWAKRKPPSSDTTGARPSLGLAPCCGRISFIRCV
jgi:pimeloyl-ACP methyl ester carboxylesterase